MWIRAKVSQTLNLALCSPYHFRYFYYPVIHVTIMMKGMMKMGRRRIGGQRENNDKLTTEQQILSSLVQRPLETRGLFAGQIHQPAAKMAKNQRDYFLVADKLKQYYANDKQVDEDVPTLKEVSGFYLEHFRLLYKCEPLDYNWFNFLKVSESIMTYFQFRTLIELVDFYCRSLVNFESAKKSLNLYQKIPDISMYKQTWILDKLNDSSTRFQGYF